MSEELIEQYINYGDFSQFPQVNQLLERMVKDGVINETAVRNHIIRKRFDEVLKRKGGRVYAAVYTLSEQFNLSQTAIEKIIYEKKAQ